MMGGKPATFRLARSRSRRRSNPYDDYDASPVHRFFQMFQELDCNAAAATAQNASGCAADLFLWVETSVGAGSNGAAQPPSFTDETTGEGSTAMGFYNVHGGDAPYLTYLVATREARVKANVLLGRLPMAPIRGLGRRSQW